MGLNIVDINVFIQRLQTFFLFLSRFFAFLTFFKIFLTVFFTSVTLSKLTVVKHGGSCDHIARYSCASRFLAGIDDVPRTSPTSLPVT